MNAHPWHRPCIGFNSWLDASPILPPYHHRCEILWRGNGISTQWLHSLLPISTIETSSTQAQTTTRGSSQESCEGNTTWTKQLRVHSDKFLKVLVLAEGGRMHTSSLTASVSRAIQSTHIATKYPPCLSWIVQLLRLISHSWSRHRYFDTSVRRLHSVRWLARATDVLEEDDMPLPHFICQHLAWLLKDCDR